jgi:hypothetical protein
MLLQIRRVQSFVVRLAVYTRRLMATAPSARLF